MSIRVSTFNCENVFARYRFKKNEEAMSESGFQINDLAFDIFDETQKQITAQAIKEVNADIIALAEIESLPVLDSFNSRYLPNMKYKHRILIDSHDPRNIDVALLSRYPIGYVKSFRHERNAANTGWLFSRDCLEVGIDISGKEIVLYVNHFKSMIGGRDKTKDKRVEQVERVAKIIDDKWKSKKYDGNFIVLGDFNDYIDEDTSLTSLVNHPGLDNVVERLPKDKQWTHFYQDKNEYRQLDYLLLSKGLARNNKNKPEIMRKGMPYRAEKYQGDRLENVGENNPKASDHAPIFMDIELL